jgi:hypothetical protein
MKVLRLGITKFLNLRTFRNKMRKTPRCCAFLCGFVQLFFLIGIKIVGKFLFLVKNIFDIYLTVIDLRISACLVNVKQSTKQKSHY